MTKKQIIKSETITENLFRDFYGSDTFIEKSAIPSELGFQSKKSSSQNKGYPDFLREEEDYFIVVEAKATEHSEAISEVQHYLLKNSVSKDIVGINAQKSQRVSRKFAVLQQLFQQFKKENGIRFSRRNFKIDYRRTCI
jgi:hypothetical protein